MAAIDDLREPEKTSNKTPCKHKIKKVRNSDGEIERRCEKCGIEAHSDGDYSYCCGWEHCRCMA